MFPFTPQTVKASSMAGLAIATEEEFRGVRVVKINGQRITNVRDIVTHMSSHSNLAECDLKLGLDFTKTTVTETGMNLVTAGCQPEAVPITLTRLQDLNDKVHQLVVSVLAIRNRDKLIKVSSHEEEVLILSRYLWSFIAGNTDEKTLTKEIGLAIDNFNMIELLQYLNPIIQEYKDILTDGLKNVK